MSAVVEDLGRRLTAVENEIAELRAIVVAPAEQSASERGAELMRRAKASAPMVAAMWEKIAKDMGLDQLEQISPEKLRELIIAGGIKPEDNEFSREIIRQRYGE